MNTILLNAARHIIQAQHKSYRTEQAYIDWIYRFLLFHQKIQVTEFSEKEIQSFLNFLSKERKVAAATRNQALQAIVFFYKQVLHITLPNLSFLRAQKITRLPPVLTRTEVGAILSQLKGEALLMTSLLYGCGLRLKECLSLRIKDIDLKQSRLIINGGEKSEGRILNMPQNLMAALNNRIQMLHLKYERWIQEGFCGVYVPEALDQQFPNASLDWQCQYIFPSDRPSVDPRSGKLKLHRRSDSFLEKAIKQAAVAARLSRTVSCHIFRNSFATHLLENGYNIRIVQQLLGHSSVRATRIFAYTLNLKTIVRSPLDELYKLQ